MTPEQLEELARALDGAVRMTSPADYGFRPRPLVPAQPTWPQALTKVDESLSAVAALIRTARLTNRPQAVAFHLALADKLLDLRLRAMKEIP